MKKTMTINLNGFVFNIDEDAYMKLHQYLEDLGRHFSPEEKDEILGDIEARIAEMFTSRLVNRNVVDMKDVEEMISVMGQPNEIDDGEEAKENKSTATSNAASPGRKQIRKLYRDRNNKMIGGVASGIAAYMDWDVALVRLLFVLVLLLSFGWTLFIYILMWIFIPEAKSVAQYLEMQGVEPNVDNIKNYSVTNEPHENSTPSTFAKIVKIAAIVLLGLFGLVLFASVFGVLTAIILLIFDLLPGVVVGTNEILLMLSVALFLLCPAIAIGMFCFYIADPHKPRRRWVAWMLLALWLLSVVGLVVTGARAYNHRDQIQADRYWGSSIIADDSNVDMVKESRMLGEFSEINAEDAIDVRFEQGDTTTVELKAPSNRIAQVRTEVRDGILYIRNDNEQLRRDEHITIRITAPDLKAIKISDACRFKAETPLRTNKLTVDVEENSTIKLSGKVDTLLVKVEEAVFADLEDMDADMAQIQASEASHVSMGNARELYINSNEASMVTYRGNPQILKKTRQDFSITYRED